MRILHTSDWHLGANQGATSRGPDHDAFLAWLLSELSARSVDVLVVAGDVFDAMQPSADAQVRYYRFLGQVGQTGVTQVVIVGGNHDSASRLDAPAQVLAALDVHVIGGIGGATADWERCLVPLRDRAGVVSAVALAVPYVHEFRLGVRTTDLNRAAVRAQFEERFGAVYRHLSDLAQERWPGLPLIATGHLTLGSAKREDYPHEIHQVGQIDGLPESVLDDRIQYAALGHIHRSYPVGERRRAWYSGSPVALSLPEAKTARRVLVVDVSADPAGQAVVTPVPVPAPRGLVTVRGEPQEVVDALKDLSWSEPLPPLVYCRVVAELMPSDLLTRLHDALATHPEDRRPALAEVRQERENAAVVAPEDAPRPSLSELTPVQVFGTLCEGMGLTETDALSAAFSALESAKEADFQAMLGDARGDAS